MEKIIRLYVDGSPESKKAEELLKGKGIPYFPLTVKKGVPTLVAVEGVFEGLEKIKNYVEYWL